MQIEVPEPKEEEVKVVEVGSQEENVEGDAVKKMEDSKAALSAIQSVGEAGATTSRSGFDGKAAGEELKLFEELPELDDPLEFLFSNTNGEAENEEQIQAQELVSSS